jgi:hypothetical protein
MRNLLRFDTPMHFSWKAVQARATVGEGYFPATAERTLVASGVYTTSMLWTNNPSTTAVIPFASPPRGHSSVRSMLPPQVGGIAVGAEVLRTEVGNANNARGFLQDERLARVVRLGCEDGHADAVGAPPHLRYVPVHRDRPRPVLRQLGEAAQVDRVRAPRPRQAVQLLQAPPLDKGEHVRLPQPRWSMRTEEEGFDAREFTPSDRRPPVPFTPGRAPSKIVVSVCCGDSASRECLMTAAAENR